MTDYKKLCTELVDEIEGWVAYGLEGQLQLLDEIDIANAHVLIDRARAALAEPEPEGLTDEELNEPLGDLIGKWCQEGMRVKPHGTSFPLVHYVASKAYQYGLRKGRPAPEPQP